MSVSAEVPQIEAPSTPDVGVVQMVQGYKLTISSIL